MELNNNLFITTILKIILALYILKLYLVFEYKFNYSKKTADRLVNVFIVSSCLFMVILAYVFY